MADNYLERQYECYQARKAAWEHGRKYGKKVQKTLRKDALHRFPMPVAHIPLPEKFTYPFCYTPHPLCLLAAGEVQKYLEQQADWKEELSQGKMFGVLVVQTSTGELGYLAAFSGILAGKNRHPYFVPPVYDLQKPDGFFKPEEEQLSQINHRIGKLENDEVFQHLQAELASLKQTSCAALEEVKRQMKKAKERRDKRRREAMLAPEAALSATEAAAMIRESQYQKAEYKRMEHAWQERMAPLRQQVDACLQQIQELKAERKTRSAALQQRLFSQFKMRNACGEVKTLCEIFQPTIHKVPPAGAGECAAPKLLQYAYLHGWRPVAMAEFWWGHSPKQEVRRQGQFYPACKGKCGPILAHMLQGLDVEENPLLTRMRTASPALKILFEDDDLLVVDKPAGMLSVPGKEAALSVYDLVRSHCPEADGPLMVHRLDMDTSGLLVVAKSKPVHQHLQAQFQERQVGKRYIVLLEGVVAADSGTIELPLRPDLLDRPRQVVDMEHGKPAVTDYEVLERSGNRTLLAFYPLTGRTHQLRVHAAHPLGLHCPIVGDNLYGSPADRLYLHAETLKFMHPATGEWMTFTSEPLFGLKAP